MNTTLVDEINNKVGENDFLIHLGDFSFGGFDNIAEFRGRILCKNIHLFLNDLLKLILYLPSKIDLWAYFYCGFSSDSEYLFKEGISY